MDGSVKIASAERYAAILACPACEASVTTEGVDVRCASCGVTYSGHPASEQIDLRLKASKAFQSTYMSDSAAPLDRYFPRGIPASPKPACPQWATIALGEDLTYGNRLSRELLSYFPAAEDEHGWMLDLGCGDRRFEALCRSLTGFNYVGVDHDGTEPDFLADAHALPFRSASFDFILSIAVLEHLAVPALAIAEIARVLKPGGVFIGTVAFLEPFHMASHFHMTHLGLARLLGDANFDVVAIEPTAGWTGMRAQAEMALFPGLNPRLQRLVAAVPTFAAGGLTKMKRALGKEVDDLEQLTAATGGFRFIARRPGE